MKRLLSILSIALAVSCHGTIDPEGDNGAILLPEGVDTTINLASGYAKKQIAMQFTSVGCVNCPFLADAIKDVQKNRPGEIIPVAFHMDFGGYEDPMTLASNLKYFEKVATGEGLPMFALNFRKSSQHIINEYAKIVSEIDLQAKNYPAVCGVAVSAEFDSDARKVTVAAKFKSDVARIYRYHIFLVEDGIEYLQQGSDAESYIHNNVLRAYAGDNILGSKLNAGEYVEPGKEYEIAQTLDVSADWNADNMRVVVAVLDSRDGGKTFYANNAAECAFGKSSDYAFEGDLPMIESRFQKHVCVMEFTGVWCSQCPEGATTVNYLVDRLYEGKTSLLAFHNGDVYALPQEQEFAAAFKFGVYPSYIIDMRKDMIGELCKGGCGADIDEALYNSAVHCGAAVECSFDPATKTAEVNAKMFSELNTEYRIAAYVVEDKVIGEQTMSDNTVRKDYSHRHVVRKMLSSTIYGDGLSKVAPETEKEKTYTFTVADDWDIEKLSVAVLILDKKGSVNNMATCAVNGGKMDYEYLK